MTIDHKYQVPTIAVHTDIFERAVRSVARVNGMPTMRQTYVPQPVMGKTAAELREYIEGVDPISDLPFMQGVIEGLTKPFSADDLKNASFERSTPRFVDPDTEENLHQFFLQSHWTDTLPIILPTEARVEAMLKGTSRKRDEIVGHLRPTHFREYWEFDVEKVAVNAVMAGARPEYFPVILALAASGASARGSTTSSAAAMAVVNGPIRNEIGMNSGIGAMGPYNHANATIGRAWGLLSQNGQGGSTPGLTYLGSQGNNYAYTSITFPENEERSPWAPFHTQHGFKANESTVSAITGAHHTSFTLGLRETYWREHVQYILRGFDPHMAPTLVLDPITANQFVTRGGFDTKEKLIDWLYETASMPAKHYWDYQLIQNYIYPRATFGEEPFASKLKAAPDDMIPMFEKEAINVVVVGGETNGYWRIISGNYQKTVSVDEWR
ncbi:MAG: UGSC family (seleno)protein [Chloroflexota bacterium]